LPDGGGGDMLRHFAYCSEEQPVISNIKPRPIQSFLIIQQSPSIVMARL
jgi:hypothetical protein